MDNVFDTIRNKMPAPRKADADNLAKLDQQKLQQPIPGKLSEMDTKALVAAWQKDEKPEYTSELLKRMKPTIDSAMNSYAPGSGDKLAVKAATLTLNALRAYNPAFDTEPSTIVFHGLKRLNRLSSNRDNIMPVPEGLALERKLLMDRSKRFEDDRGREPSVAELADLTGLSQKKINRLLDMNTVVSESATLTDENFKDTVTSGSLGEDDYFEYVYASVGPVDQKIMEWTSGKHGKQVLSNNEIARKLRITPAAVSQRKNRILSMMSDIRGLL